VRVVAWNIRAGGGVRADAIARQLARWQADIVALSEFRATPPSARLAARLVASGLAHQLTTCDPRTMQRNALLVASRWPLRRIGLRAAPADRCRWLLVAVDAPLPLVLGTMHVPNRISGRKYPFLDAVLGCARRWGLGPALLIGDTNSGRRGLDEEVPAFNAREEGWVDALAGCGWADAFRQPADRRTRLHVVLAERAQRVSHRPGVRQRAAADAAEGRGLRVGRRGQPRPARPAQRSRGRCWWISERSSSTPSSSLPQSAPCARGSPSALRSGNRRSAR